MSRPPNIVLIITDQQRYDTIAALGWPHMVTPTLDRLVREGTAFTHTYTTGASCVPARASLFTGYYPHTIGVMRNTDAWRHSWVEDLNAAGYHCVNVGKMHTVPFDAPCGFHERYIVENKERRGDFGGRQYFDLMDVMLAANGHNRIDALNYRGRADYSEALGAFEWPLEERLHHDFFVGNLAKWWLREHRRRRDSKKPVFLQIGFPGPHPPYDPVARFLEPYRIRDIPIPVLEDQDLDGQPAPFKSMRERMYKHEPDSIVHQVRPPAEALRKQRAYYAANVTMIDAKVAEIFAALGEEGYLDDCVVIFTSDHGDTLTEHGQCTKWTMYEPAVRVPLLFWGPGRVPAGRQIDGLVQLMDVGATVLELGAVASSPGMEARSLVGAFGVEPFPGRDHVYCEHGRDKILDGTELVTMVRNRDWKLVDFIDLDEGQLFDLRTDPRELVNRWSDPAAREVRAALAGQLVRWRLTSQVHARDWSAARR